MDELRAYFDSLGEFTLVGANHKFDLNLLHVKGYTIPWERWSDDITLMATCLTEKIPKDYLEHYEQRRQVKNESLPPGIEHRKSKEHGLKALAPYFLGVEAFWEDPADHDNETYVLKDCEYTYRLESVLREKMEAEGSYKFYREKMMNWAKILARMERRGIRIDLSLLEKLDAEARNKKIEAKQTIDTEWAPAFAEYERLIRLDKQNEYAENMAARFQKLEPEKQTEAKLAQLEAYYEKLHQKSLLKPVAPFNLDSPDQMRWLLRDYFHLEIEDFDGDESTGKAVLQRLAAEGRKDIEAFLNYRKQSKLTSSFFPTYRDLHNDGILRATFWATTARTGRLSSSDPNLQQVTKGLHKLFIPRDGYKFIIKDQAAIEPRLIAYFSEDPILYDILARGLDFHGYNTKIFFGLECEISEVKKLHPLEREVGKEVGLAILYGAGAKRLQESAMKRGFVWTFNECQAKVDKFRAHYETIKKFHKTIDDHLWSNAVTNLLGRQFRIKERYDIYMKGLNTLIQGSASDLVLHSAMRAQQEFDRLGLDAHILLLVHDEIVLECRAEIAEQCEKILEFCMTDYNLTTCHGPITLKVEGHIADCWEK